MVRWYVPSSSVGSVGPGCRPPSGFVWFSHRVDDVRCFGDDRQGPFGGKRGKVPLVCPCVLPWERWMCDIVVTAANVAGMMTLCLFRHARAQGGGALGGRRGEGFVFAVGLVVVGGGRYRDPVELK